ncbi:family 78 glycoside hydrolase catalytic domain [Cohnella sp. GCM10027633]|uniref:family 78 glycoside hydrolase catalytic domain n=1 Tax=unclassified Cohnella TaxID=2636738 RepID=UPI00363BA5F3
MSHREALEACELKVNCRVDPLAIEGDPDFSWKLRSGQIGASQGAYRIVVRREDEVMWDSGVVRSDDTLQIAYPGKPLSAGTRYSWTLEIGDSEWKEPSLAQSAFFDTGLSQEDWKAAWIWKQDGVIANDFAYFRKAFELSEAPALAKIYVSAHHHYQLFVNGTRVGGLLSPAPSEPAKSKLYLGYEVTGLLGAGENCIAAAVHYIGGGGQNYVDGQPGLILQAEWRTADGETGRLVTDESWKALSRTPYENGAAYQQNRRVSAIEAYDSRLEPDGWRETGFDDSSWSSAVLSPVQALEWRLRPQTIPEGYAEEEIVPVPCGVQRVGWQVFDAGKIVSGWAKLELRGVKDAVVRMRYSEDLLENGEVKHNVANEDSETYYDEYTSKGSPIERWEPDFSYKAFRYVEVTGCPVWLEPEQAIVVSAHTALDYGASFECSEPLLNRIYEACIQTQKNNALGQLTDCPHREQAQYLADSDMQAETLGYGFDSHRMLLKVLADFSDAQEEDGRFPFVFPTNTESFGLRIPEWDLHFVTLLWKMYEIFDDRLALSEYFNAAETMARYYLGRIDETGLVPKYASDDEGWHISDWPYPDIDHSGPYLTVHNLKLAHALDLLSRIAALIGKEAEHVRYAEASADLRAAVRRHLYDAERGCFADSYGSAESHQGTNVVGFQYGALDDGEREALLQRIEEGGLGCRTLLALNLFRVLFENGRGETAFRLLNRTEFPGWGHMIDKGSRTTWEGFDDIESHSHAWNAYPARLFLQYLAGIAPASPGFKTIRIRPTIPEGLAYVRSSIETVRGTISVRWERLEGGGLRLEATIPANTAGCLVVPKPWGEGTEIALPSGRSSFEF